MIRPLYKKSFRAIANKILNLNKGKITSIRYEFPQYEMIQISSNGDTLERAIDEEKLIITFKTNSFKKLYREEKK